jgi:hypothetical protein
LAAPARHAIALNEQPQNSLELNTIIGATLIEKQQVYRKKLDF